MEAPLGLCNSSLNVAMHPGENVRKHKLALAPIAQAIVRGRVLAARGDGVAATPALEQAIAAATRVGMYDMYTPLG